MYPRSLEEINKMSGVQVARALESRALHVNDIDKAVLVLDKLQSLGTTKPTIVAECKHLENFIKKFKH